MAGQGHMTFICLAANRYLDDDGGDHLHIKETPEQQQGKAATHLLN
jgi:hypothetical protein